MFSSANFIFLSFTCCSVTQSCQCLTVYDPMNYSMWGFPVLHHLPEFAQPHVLWVSDAIQPEIYNLCGIDCYMWFEVRGQDTMFVLIDTVARHHFKKPTLFLSVPGCTSGSCACMDVFLSHWSVYSCSHATLS